MVCMGLYHWNFQRSGALAISLWNDIYPLFTLPKWLVHADSFPCYMWFGIAICNTRQCKVLIFSQHYLLHLLNLRFHCKWHSLKLASSTYSKIVFIKKKTWWRHRASFKIQKNWVGILKYIVACERGGVSKEPPWLRAAMRHGPLTL